MRRPIPSGRVRASALKPVVPKNLTPRNCSVGAHLSETPVARSWADASENGVTPIATTIATTSPTLPTLRLNAHSPRKVRPVSSSQLRHAFAPRVLAFGRPAEGPGGAGTRGTLPRKVALGCRARLSTPWTALAVGCGVPVLTEVNALAENRQFSNAIVKTGSLHHVGFRIDEQRSHPSRRC